MWIALGMMRCEADLGSSLQGAEPNQIGQRQTLASYICVSERRRRHDNVTITLMEPRLIAPTLREGTRSPRTQANHDQTPSDLQTTL